MYPWRGPHPEAKVGVGASPAECGLYSEELGTSGPDLLSGAGGVHHGGRLPHLCSAAPDTPGALSRTFQGNPVVLSPPVTVGATQVKISDLLGPPRGWRLAGSWAEGGCMSQRPKAEHPVLNEEWRGQGPEPRVSGAGSRGRCCPAPPHPPSPSRETPKPRQGRGPCTSPRRASQDPPATGPCASWSPCHGGPRLSLCLEAGEGAREAQSWGLSRGPSRSAR